MFSYSYAGIIQIRFKGQKIRFSFSADIISSPSIYCFYKDTTIAVPVQPCAAIFYPGSLTRQLDGQTAADRRRNITAKAKRIQEAPAPTGSR